MTIQTEARRVRVTVFCGLTWALSIAALTQPLSYAGENPADVQSAKEILKATGIRGGLVVHLGSGDGKLTAALRAGESYVVHGLDADAANVQTAREHIRSLGLSGKVSVDRFSGNRLPYVDNLVRLIVAQRPPEVSMDEVLRVLAPSGVAYVNNDRRWTKTVKPWPQQIDQWTHFLHDASGNAVARDTRVGPPRHVQWMAAPTWSRYHHTLASISSVVSAAGRIFYIVDQASAASMEVPGKWSVVARDAFNGVLLWKRPIRTWAWHRHGFRSGPVQLPRTLVAAADHVYLPLGLGAPVSALDAATGEIVRTYRQTRGTEEIILHQGMILAVTGSPLPEQAMIGPQRSPTARFPNEKQIVAIRAETGEVLWRWSEPPDARLVPLTLAAAGPRVFFAAGKDVVCVDRNTGNALWRWAAPGAAAEGRKPAAGRQKAGQPRKTGKKKKPGTQRRVGWSVATLVVQDGVVLWADGGRLAALSAAHAKTLWTCPCRPGFRSPADVFVAAGLVWLGPEFSAGRDLHTGEVKRTNTAVQEVWTIGHHHRCYREKATDRYVLTGKRGIEFIDLVGDNHTRNNWVRGECQYGVMPSGGLIYAPSHSCGCFMEAKLYGFWALAPEKRPRPQTENSDEARLERGPAFPKDTLHPSSFISQPSSFIPHPSTDWPTHRHDPMRSGSTTTEVPMPLKDLWQADVGGRLSAPVVAEGTVLVSSIDTHRVVALDARDGNTRWTFTAGGRVDSPPTIHRHLVLFGCADGWVYCLRLADGRLVWRFRAAPEDLRTVALDQVESVWPVHGSVLVQHGVAYVAAGRSSYLDGGIFLYGLDPMTGSTVCRGCVRTGHPKAGEGENGSKIAPQKIVQNATDYKTFTAPDRSDAFAMGGATSDILVGDGTSIFLRHLRFDRDCVQQEKKGRHLFSTSRLLDDAENHRSHWVLGTGDFTRMPVSYSWIAYNPNRFGWSLFVPYGLMLAFDEQTVWGVKRSGGGYLLFARGNRPFSADEPPLPDFRRPDESSPPKPEWSVKLTMRPRAMLQAGNVLFLGGMTAATEQTDLHALYEGRKGGLLLAVSADDGKALAQHKLASPPVWDGLAAAAGRVYLSTHDARLLCFGGEK